MILYLWSLPPLSTTPVWSLGNSLTLTGKSPGAENPLGVLLTTLISGCLFIYKRAIPIKIWNVNQFSLSNAKPGKDHWKTIQKRSSSKQTQGSKGTKCSGFVEDPGHLCQVYDPRLRRWSLPVKAKLCSGQWTGGGIQINALTCLARSGWIYAWSLANASSISVLSNLTGQQSSRKYASQRRPLGTPLWGSLGLCFSHFLDLKK